MEPTCRFEITPFFAVPRSSVAIVALALPVIASARPTANLLANPSFESGFGGWSASGAQGGTGPVADAPDGKSVAWISNWFLNRQMSLNSAWQPLDGRIVAGTCTLTAQARTNVGPSRSGYVVLRERNGFGAVIHQYTSPRVNLTRAFQMLTAAGTFTAQSGNKLEASMVVDGNNVWGGDSTVVDLMDARCKALPPLHVHLGAELSLQLRRGRGDDPDPERTHRQHQRR